MYENIFKTNVHIPQAIKDAALQALPCFIKANNFNDIQTSIHTISRAFSNNICFDNFVTAPSSERDKNDHKLISSFQKNAHLLVQKTWVEEGNEELKEETLYQIERLCTYLQNTDHAQYTSIFNDFFKILKDFMYLLFGTLVETSTFLEYAIRIEPDFGFFWFYIDQISAQDIFPEEKSRLAVLLGMFFLANF